MKKFAVFLFFAFFCLSMQLVTASQQQERNDNKIKESNETKSNKISSRTLLLMLVRTTVDVVGKYSNTIILEKGQFIADLLTELIVVPKKTAYIEKLIPELSSILKQKET
ncbi:PREDICTED: uncharacterized protein LOC108372018 [Rhagoletis zephyria]|uniref:uncharacterized protein LOC108372018 n=1 Tax=Rhagoletis zephyria TaxID=28612 RepID=UPI00081182FA|nr:PREDICTED: uncharacterized protein LOC108372018 [Rhagoletis zephyria]